MVVSLTVDGDLLDKAVNISASKSKNETVTLALEEFIQRRKMSEVIDLFGKVEYDEGYDYKILRART